MVDFNGADKRLIAECFGRALGTYDKNAVVQKHMAATLASLMRHEGFPHGASVYEVGAGTGLMTAEIVANFAPRRVVANDLCADCAALVARASGGVAEFVAGDAEALPVPDGTDAVVSCSAVHWFDDKEAFFAKVATSLDDGKFFAFSSFGPNNMRELRELGHAGLEYDSADEYATMLERAGLRVVASEDALERVFFPDMRALLSHFHETGVSGVRHGKWDMRETLRFRREYERRFREERGLPLTYHPLFFVCVRVGE